MSDEGLEEGWYGEDQATLGDRIAGAREAAGLSADELADRLGVKRSTLRKWEEDLSEPRANRLQMLAGMLGVSLSWMLTGRGEGPDRPVEEAALATDVSGLLADIRAEQARMTRSVTRLSELEKQLRRALRTVA